jgi:predicted exporter
MSRVVPVGWTLVAIALGAHQVFLWTGGIALETNALAMLPTGERDPLVEGAFRELTEEGSRNVVVLVGSEHEAEASNAARAFASAVPIGRLGAVPFMTANPLELAPYREGLLTPKQASWLASQTPQSLADRALTLLQQPVSLRVGTFVEDPLQLFPEWLVERGSGLRVRSVGDQLVVDLESKHFVVLRYRVAGSAFAVNGEPVLKRQLSAAAAALPASIEVLMAGVPLFAEEAASAASQEVSVVGFGSVVAIVLMVLVAFRSGRPLVLVVLSVAMGVTAGLSATALVFERVHVMTLVFGASLVGVAEDYGIHYFASRQASPRRSSIEVLSELRPSLFLAMATSVAGYAVLAVAPFSVLRQMALFSSVGLLAAWATVIAWYPWLDRGEVKQTRLAASWSASRASWPTLRGPRGAIVLSLLVVVAFAGMARLRPNDDLRLLSASSPELLETQRRVAAALGLPSPAQFLLVRGANENEVLEREEALTSKLEALVRDGRLKGFQGISRWVPSRDRQREHQRQFTLARDAVLATLSDRLEEASHTSVSQRLLTVDAFLATSFGAEFRPLWRTGSSLVLLEAPTSDLFPDLAALSALPGVTFVNSTESISTVLGQWRGRMTELLAGGYTLVLVVLAWRFRRRAFRALAPTALASALALSVVGISGEPLTLFHILGLWVLLGTGVDYGIFLLEHSVSEGGEAWLAVGLGAVSTLLSFGLLATSSTFAIHAFGLTLGIGTLAVWVLSPMIIDLVSEPVSSS